MYYIKSWGLSILTALGFVQQPVEFSVKNLITIVEGDITQQTVDAIVNAANEDLNHAGGVALAISRAAGPELQKYSNSMPFIEDQFRCPMGKAVITPSFNLTRFGIKKIIHTTGPRGDTLHREELLSDCYKNSLKMAKEHNIRTIAFPSISTAIFGYDIHQAAPVALQAIKNYIDEHPYDFDEIRLVLFSPHDFKIYQHAINVLLNKK